MEKKILMIAGEESGDLHGADLIAELKEMDSELEIIGIGGDKMKNMGMTTIFHINDMAFLGFFEVIKHLPFIRKVKKELIEIVTKDNIKSAILIDYPGFNLSLAKSLHGLGVKNIYYISPQIWAWGKGRINKIKKIIDRMIVLFPFEEKLYKRNNISADFVGHPLLNKLNNFNFASINDLKKKYDISGDKDILLLLPGSRKQEIDKILEILLEASDKLSFMFNLQTVVACAENIAENIFNKYKESHNFILVKGDTYNLMKNAKFSIIKSGTSTLEAGIIGNPFLVVYKTSGLTYFIGKMLISIKNIALSNIVAEKAIVKELIQNEVTINNIIHEAKRLLSNSTEYDKMKNELEIIKNKLQTEGNPSKKAAEIIYDELNVV